ncbi:hypothetical protein [Emticicia sp. 17c]|uniref:hypothetical protein n=1 Tax=Emticicia sp. 17c TaxID=3127704 RepID=UPI00301BDCF0
MALMPGCEMSIVTKLSFFTINISHCRTKVKSDFQLSEATPPTALIPAKKITMAKGIKYFKTVEKGDILTAEETTKIYELQENGSLKVIDTAFKGDLIGFYTGGMYKLNGIQYLEILTIDSVNTDGSINFERIPLYFKWDYSNVTYTPNPNYNYPDKPEVTQQVGVITWVADNSAKLWILIGGIAIAVIAYIAGKKIRK